VFFVAACKTQKHSAGLNSETWDKGADGKNDRCPAGPAIKPISQSQAYHYHPQKHMSILSGVSELKHELYVVKSIFCTSSSDFQHSFYSEF